MELDGKRINLVRKFQIIAAARPEARTGKRLGARGQFVIDWIVFGTSNKRYC